MTGALAVFLSTAIGLAGQPDPSGSQDPPSEAMQATDDPTSVRISQVYTIFERKGGVARVSQILELNTDEGSVFSNPNGYVLSLPKGAGRAGTMSEEDAKIEILQDRVVVRDLITPQGVQVSFIFELPVNRGTAVLEQQFPTAIAAAQAITMWTLGEVDIRGDGFGPADLYTPPSGITGLAIAGHNLGGKPLRIIVSGLEEGPQALRRNLTLALCLVLSVVGLAAWLRRRIAGSAREDEPSRAHRA